MNDDNFVPLERAGEREDVAHIVIYNQHLSAGEHGICLTGLGKQLPFALREISFHTMEEQIGLIQELLVGLRAAQNDPVGNSLQRHLLLSRKLFTAVEDDRNLDRKSVV